MTELRRPFNEPMTEPPAWDAPAVEHLAEDLRVLPYTTEALGELLGETALAALDREQAEPARRRVQQIMHDDGAADSQRALVVVVSLWMLGDPVRAELVDAALPRLGAHGAADLNLGLLRENILYPVVDLSPYATDDHGDLWITSDQTALQTERTLPGWHVVGIGRASLTLAGNVIRRPVRRALDLGTGCGIQTVHLLAHAEHVTATDLSTRALSFTAFNLVLNARALGLDARTALFGPGGRVTLLAGDLLEPVAGQRFDLIVSNPPFVISPRTASDPGRLTGEPVDGINTYRDGGRTGDYLLAELIASLPDHLEPGGIAQMLGNWEIPTGASAPSDSVPSDSVPGATSPQQAGWDERPRRWIPEGLDAWIIQRDLLDPAGYAETWLQDSSEQLDPARYAAGYRDYLDGFAAREVAAVGFGYLWLRRPAEPRAGRIRTEVLEGELQQPLGPAWADAVDRWDTIAAGSVDGSAELRDLRLRVAADVTEERHQRFGAEHPEVILARQGGSFRRTARLDTATAGFMAAADGEFSVGQLTGAVAGLLDLDEAGEQALMAAVADLFADGFLVAS
ncbi:methyltransferase [Citricoccus sp. GCM10030269]|uniref:DUF7059 domain-containing protein n=1 Tax=Citricoccus sp. GCM10030269 TaxID=3273388 RepID=UPI0036235115